MPKPRLATPRCIANVCNDPQVDPATGAVVGWLRATDLRNRAQAAAQVDAQAAQAAGKEAAAARNGGPEVLNGIAYDAAGGRLFITGGCRGQGLGGARRIVCTALSVSAVQRRRRDSCTPRSWPAAMHAMPLCLSRCL